jgi:hypothetical protein
MRKARGKGIPLAVSLDQVDSGAIASFVHVLVQILDSGDGGANLHVDVSVVLL